MTQKMTFQFDLTKDDFIAFSKHSTETSPTLRQVWVLSIVLPPLVFLLAATYFGLKGNDPSAAIPWLLAAIAYVTIMLLRGRKRSTFIMRRLLNERTMAAYIGTHHVTVADDAIKCEYPGGTAVTKLVSIIHFCETVDHLFLYNSAISAIILPKRQLPADIADFLRRRLASESKES